MDKLITEELTEAIRRAREAFEADPENERRAEQREREDADAKRARRLEYEADILRNARSGQFGGQIQDDFRRVAKRDGDPDRWSEAERTRFVKWLNARRLR